MLVKKGESFTIDEENEKPLLQQLTQNVDIRVGDIFTDEIWGTFKVTETYYGRSHHSFGKFRCTPVKH
ncbi:hypothetical protein ABC970_22225 [Bacillus licheniformis]|uniref:hypothetical protein n=1 Tax=Bacillus TaxID=1386 RepID=UPI000472A6EB|nr:MULTISPECIES: hypothetical protein [Bacillus]ASK26222.1 hypothetical protein BSSX_p0031 [Bacillus subtilis]MCQ5304570.1 hypothetical protein [Bacillus licheniformis]MDM5287382.1 hypothetical protein [Bacillus licheniformis]MEC0776926.1 hypothetical protein [Bacillus licheniformis]MED1661742.1 hypothetical protein [Bacillus licheniformis]